MKLKMYLARAIAYTRPARHWITAKAVLAVFWLLRLMSPDRALNLADNLGRRVGPWVGRHRVALTNLRNAYPDKNEAEINTIALDMWGNMARMAAEYVFLDKLADINPDDQSRARVEVDGIELFNELQQVEKPRIFITAHTGCFEMIPLAAAAFGLDVASLFRAPNNPYIARELSEARQVSQAQMVASRAGAAGILARILDRGGNIGVLVDQKFLNGIPTTFFGLPCKSSPLVPRLARTLEPDIYPVRCIRLPGNRYRLQLLDKIEPARNEKGVIDPPMLAQQLNDIVEGWVREYPGQWMWFHKRWA